MTQACFLVFATSWILFLVWRVNLVSEKKSALILLLGCVVWLVYASLLARFGILNSPAMPPRLLLLLIPILSFSIWLIRSAYATVMAGKIPMRELVGMQSFRILVEIFLNQLRKDGLVPEAMTFHGQNFDILIGISALALYLVWNRIPNQAMVSRLWNILGLVFLANVVLTGILSVPGPLHILNLKHPNIAITQFPFVFIPALFVLSAFSLHILALKSGQFQNTIAGNVLR